MFFSRVKSSLCRAYLCFNLLVMILELFDSLLHLYVIYHLYRQSNWTAFAVLCISFFSTQVFKTISCFNTNSLLFMSCCFFGNFLHFFKFQNKHQNITGYLRINQLHQKYTHALSVNYPANHMNYKFSDSNTIGTFSQCLIDHYGVSFDFCVHEIFESLPFSIFLLLAMIYYQDFNNYVFTVSIVMSILCMICQLFTFISSKHNIHFDVSLIIFTLICVDIFLFFSVLSWLSHVSYNNYWHTQITDIYKLKYKVLTLPLSFGVSVLTILRKVTLDYNYNRPQQSQAQLCATLSYLLLTVLVVFVSVIFASFVLDICFNFVWIAFVIDHIFNKRFSKNDENTQFWRKMVEFINEKDENDIVIKRLFAANSILASKASYFPNSKLSKWMNKEYVNVYYKHEEESSTIALKDFGQYYGKNNFKSVCKSIFRTKFDEYFSDLETISNINQFFYDLLNFFNICNVFNPNNINSVSNMVFSMCYTFTLYIGVFSYFLSRCVTFLFPFVYAFYFVFYPNCYQKSSTLKYYSFPLVMTYLYSISFVILLLLLAFKFKRTASRIWYLVPGYYACQQMYVAHNPNNDMQSNIYNAIMWYYQTHNFAPPIAKMLHNKFGNDISSVIVEYLPMSYQESIIEN